MILARIQVREILAFHITVAEAGCVVGIVGLTVQIDITVILEDLDHLIPDIYISFTAAIHADERLGVKIKWILNRRFLVSTSFR